MRAQVIAIACVLAGCVAVAGGEDGPRDDPADVVPDPDELGTQMAPEDEGPGDPPVAVSANARPPVRRRREDPWAIYRRDRELYRAWMGETAPVPTSRRERRRLIKEERKLERACREGQARADAEIRAGELGRLEFGLPSNCWVVARERAERELGIRLGGMGCVADDESEAMVSCYNTTMACEIEARGLDDDFERIFAEACGD